MKNYFPCGFFSCTSESESSNSNEDGIEQTLVIIKGDVISRGLLGEMISNLEMNFSIVAIKFIEFDKDLVDKFYGGAKKMEFYHNLTSYMTTGYHAALILEGENVIQNMLALKGKYPNDKEETLRRKYALSDVISSIHCSHNFMDAKREIRLFFNRNEIYQKIPNITEYTDVTKKVSTNIINI